MLTEDEELDEEPRRWTTFGKLAAVLAIMLIFLSLYHAVTNP